MHARTVQHGMVYYTHILYIAHTTQVWFKHIIIKTSNTIWLYMYLRFCARGECVRVPIKNYCIIIILSFSSFFCLSSWTGIKIIDSKIKYTGRINYLLPVPHLPYPRQQGGRPCDDELAALHHLSMAYTCILHIITYYTHTYMYHTHTYMYMYIHTCMYTCACRSAAPTHNT